LDIRVEGSTLTVSGERKFEHEEKKENYRRIERAYGSLSRSFNLPPSADTDSIKASFENGILEVDIPKRAEARGKQIQISARAGDSAQKQKAA
jgi:HSP20 family protein